MFTDLLILTYLLAGSGVPKALGASSVALAQRSFPMTDRYDNSLVNDIFRDNILLTVHYLANDVKNPAKVDWNEVDSPFHTEFTLKPGEEFAFHDGVLPQYKNIVKTTGVYFNSGEGFKSDGWLVGDGVCHFASLIYWAARDAGLTAYAPSNHNFAKINDVPKKYGVAIEAPMPMGNLYITNNLDKPVTFNFDYKDQNLTVSITEAK